MSARTGGGVETLSILTPQNYEDETFRVVPREEEQESAKGYTLGQEIQEPRKYLFASDFFYEALRLLTFGTFVSENVDVGELAREGFVCVHNGDLAQCVYCSGILGLWEKRDNVKKEHEKHYPDCPSVRGTMVNVPIGNEKLNQSLEYKLKHRLPKRQNRFRADSTSATPFFSHFAKDADRRRTFKNTYLYKKMPSIEKIVKAGLFSNGIADCVHCYQCGGGIFNWSHRDEPQEVHAKLYPQCKLTKEYLAEQNLEIPVQESSPPDAPSLDLEAFSELELAKELSDRWPLEFVAESFHHHYEQFLTLPANQSEGIDAIFDYMAFLEEQDEE